MQKSTLEHGRKEDIKLPHLLILLNKLLIWYGHMNRIKDRKAITIIKETNAKPYGWIEFSED